MRFWSLHSAPGQARRALPAAGFVFVCLWIAYLSALTKQFNFDGVCFATHAESGDVRLLFHPNHVLYTAAGWVYWQIENLIGIHSRALFALQRFDALCGALTGAAVFWLWSRLFKPAWAWAAALSLAFSYAFWRFSTEAQAYGPAVLLGTILFALIACYEKAGKSPPAKLLFCLLLISSLAHTLQASLVLPLGWLLWKERGWRYSIGFAGLFIAGFLGVQVALALWWGLDSIPETARFFLGNVGGRMPGTVLNPVNWRFHILLNPLIALKSLTESFFGPHQGWSLWALQGITFLGIGACFLPLIRRNGGKTWWVAALWVIAFHIVFFVVDFPEIAYRGLLMVPLLYLATCALEKAPGMARKAVAPAIILLVLGNAAAILPGKDFARNKNLHRCWFLESHITPRDFLVFHGNDFPVGRAYLPYFTRIRGTSLKTYLMRFGKSTEPLKQIFETTRSAGGKIFCLDGVVNPSRLSNLESKSGIAKGALTRFFQAYGMNPVARMDDGFGLWILEGQKVE